LGLALVVRPGGVFVALATSSEPLRDEPIIRGLRFRGAKHPEIVVAAVEPDDGLTAGLVETELRNGGLAGHGVRPFQESPYGTEEPGLVAALPTLGRYA
jgi:hypothetical protein